MCGRGACMVGGPVWWEPVWQGRMCGKGHAW